MIFIHLPRLLEARNCSRIWEILIRVASATFVTSCGCRPFRCFFLPENAAPPAVASAALDAINVKFFLWLINSGFTWGTMQRGLFFILFFSFKKWSSRCFFVLVLFPFLWLLRWAAKGNELLGFGFKNWA